MDRIIQDLVASFCSWRVDMGMLPSRGDNSSDVTPSPVVAPATKTSSSVPTTKSQEDPEYYRIANRYPEHMLHCPQTSLYPIFFFIMERWEARRASKQNVLVAPTPSSTGTTATGE